jgi:hypothetical protein
MEVKTLSEKRKRFYATEVDGRKAVLDMNTGIVHFGTMVASGAKLKTDVVLVPSQKEHK